MIFIDGFEEFAGATSPTELLTRAEWTPTGSWTAVGGRGATAGSTALAGVGAALKRTFTNTQNKFVAGVAHYFTGRGSVMRLKGGAATVILWMNADTGLPTMNAAPGGALPTINRWYYYELEIDKLAGTVALYINNRLDSTIPLPSGFGPATSIEVTLGYIPPDDYDPPKPDTGQKYFDDFYARDGARIGPVIVTTRFPDIDVDVEWFKASTTLTHAQSLSLHPPSPLDSYVAADTLGKEDRFKSNTTLANDDAILATGILVMARKAPTLNARLGVFMGGNPGGAPGRSSIRTVESEWRTQYACFDQDGGDTVAGIIASEFGINVTAP